VVSHFHLLQVISKQAAIMVSNQRFSPLHLSPYFSSSAFITDYSPITDGEVLSNWSTCTLPQETWAGSKIKNKRGAINIKSLPVSCSVTGDGFLLEAVEL